MNIQLKWYLDKILHGKGQITCDTRQSSTPKFILYWLKQTYEYNLFLKKHACHNRVILSGVFSASHTVAAG